MILVSILICTRDRCEDLALTLEAIRGLTVPDGFRYEVVVVDNGSHDETRAVVERAACEMSAVRYDLEPRPGKGHALNRAVALAQGEIMLFTDDDVRPPADWIARMCGPLARDEADAVAGGIRIPPDRLAPWVGELHRNWLASTDLFKPGDEYDLVGANMALHRRVFDRVPLFDTELAPGGLGFAEDTLFSWQLKEAGYRLLCRPDVVVDHYFDPGRLTPRSFLKIPEKLGMCMGYLQYHWMHAPMGWIGPRLVFSRVKLAVLRARERRAATEGVVLTAPVLWQLRHHYMLLGYARQRGRPRKYAFHGLAPRQDS